jgi:hypothetical protein
MVGGKIWSDTERRYKMKKKKGNPGMQIESISKDALANLTVEELEQRLEMQILSIALPGSVCKADCTVHCGSFCNPITV